MSQQLLQFKLKNLCIILLIFMPKQRFFFSSCKNYRLNLSDSVRHDFTFSRESGFLLWFSWLFGLKLLHSRHVKNFRPEKKPKVVIAVLFVCVTSCELLSKNQKLGDTSLRSRLCRWGKGFENSNGKQEKQKVQRFLAARTMRPSKWFPFKWEKEWDSTEWHYTPIPKKI